MFPDDTPRFLFDGNPVCHRLWVPGTQFLVFDDRDLLEKVYDLRVPILLLAVGRSVDSALKHCHGDHVGQTMISRLLGHRAPLLRVPAEDRIASLMRSNLHRDNILRIRYLLSSL